MTSEREFVFSAVAVSIAMPRFAFKFLRSVPRLPSHTCMSVRRMSQITFTRTS
jgi:hypothetical protein